MKLIDKKDLVPSYKNSNKTEKVIAWLLLFFVIWCWWTYFTSPPSCVNDPFYSYCGE